MLTDPTLLRFVETPGNPVPEGAALDRVITADGVSLRVAHWPATVPEPRGTVCVMQGRAEFIEKYFEVVGELRERGFAVVTFDWRGQGLSDRLVRNSRKGHIGSFEEYRRDIEAVRERVLEPLLPHPHFTLAHSMGGALALWGAKEGWLPFKRVVAVAPMISIALVNRPRAARALALTLTLLGLGRSFIPGGGETSISTKPFAGNRLTSDPERYARNGQAAAAIGEGAIGDPTVGWIQAAFRFMQRLAEPRFALEIRLPTLIIAAGTDPICSTPAIERFASRLKAGHAIVLPGARHEILMERDPIRARFWAAFDAFIPGSDETFRPASAVEQVEHRREEPAVADGNH
ncbi:MAG TPA: alpha/beta hydrolase [Beijerinckiaceae bacterium]|jgi:lysophospholipase